MTSVQHEIAFIDRNVDDLTVLLASMRAGVKPILLSDEAPAPRQMAEVLKHCADIAVIHLIAHGAPGQVDCGARAFALEAIEEDREDLAAIGRALGADGSLLLWTCNVAEGERGAAFVDALVSATGAEVSATPGLVGAAALGGRWELNARSGASETRAPLTAQGIADYAAVMAVKTWTGGGSVGHPNSGNWSTSSNWSPTGAPLANDDVVIGGSIGGSYTVVLDVSPATLDSLTINFSSNTATLAIGNKTLNVNGNGAGATDTVSLNGTNAITIAGGTVNTGTLTFTGASANLIGSGTLNISGHYTGTGRLQASSGTLDVFGTVDSGVVLQINTTAGSTLKIEGTATSVAAIAISNSNQTLEIGASGNLTISAAETITNGKIQLDGGTLTDAAGLTIGSNATVTGLGTVAANIGLGSIGTITASGGVLNLAGTVTSGPTFTIATASASTLKFSGTATAAAAISITSANQTLEVGASGSLTINVAESITNGKIKLDGGTLVDNSGLTIGTAGTVTGFGKVQAAVTANGSSPPVIWATGGTLELKSTVTNTSNNLILQIGGATTDRLLLDGVSAASSYQEFGNATGSTLELNTNGTLTLANAMSVTDFVKLDGTGTQLTVNGGILLGNGVISGTGTIAANTNLTGFGTVSIPISNGNTIAVLANGTLDLTGTISSAKLQISSGSVFHTVLKIDGSATTSTAITDTTGGANTFNGANQILEIGPSGSLTINAAQTITNGTVLLDGASSLLTDGSGITLSGATISGLGTIAAGTNITGSGTVSIPISSAGTIIASGGTLDLTGTVSGRTLSIATVANSDLKIDGTATTPAAIAISSANQTLEIGASGSLTINAAESITNGKIQLDGGTLADASGLTIGAGATLTGKGTVAAPVDGTGTIIANGGTLELTGAVDSTTASSFHIANIAGSALKFDGAVGTASIHPTITFDGGLGVLDLSSDTLANFHATIANFTNAEGIKVSGAAAAVLDSSGTFLTVYDAAHTSLGTINLSASYVGNEFAVSSGTISVGADTTTPTGGTPDLTVANDSGSSHTDDITNVTGPTFNVALNGTVAVGDTVQLLLGGSPLSNPVTHTITFADLDAGSVNLTVTVDDLGADGAKSVSAKFTDLAGHVSTTSALAITLDTTIATPTVALTSDTGSSSSDNITQDAALTVSAVAADVTRTYAVDGGLASANYTAPTAEGAHAVVVTDTDTAGNTANASLSFTLDTSIATPTVALTSDTGSSNSDNITQDAALTVSAVAADVTRTYTVDGGLASANYTAPTADGSHTVVVTDTDTAGNTANASLSFTLDTSLATPTVALSNDTGSSNSDNITQDAALSFSPAAADVTRTYTVDGGLASANYTAPTAEGAHAVVVTDTDTAGNTANASLSFTLDNTIATPTVALTSDTGSSSSDNITQDAALTVSAVAADVTRTYTIDGGLASANYTAPTADGSHTVVVIDTDTAGNTANASLSFTLDNSIATPTVALTSDTGSSNSDNITSDAALTVSAAAADVTRTYTVDGGPSSASYTAPTADSAHTVVITDTDTAGNTANASLSFTLDASLATPTAALTSDTGSSNSDNITQDAALSFSPAAADVTRTYTIDGGPSSASYTAPTTDGSHTVVVIDTDTAGNAANASLSFTLDTSIATPTVALTSDTGSSNSDNITQDAALTVSAVAADVTRTYTIDGGPSSASYTAPTTDGSYTVVVTDTDTAGNTANASLSFTLDTSLATPTVALSNDTGSSNSDNITQDAALSFSPAAADVTRTYTIDGGLASANYTAPTADGSHTVVVIDTDTAGNTTNAGLSFTLDNSIATPTVALTSDTGSSNSDNITQDAALTVSAAAADVTRTYAVDGGALSASYTAPTADGAHTVVITDTNTAGSSATASLSFSLDNTIATPTVALSNDTGSSSSDNITQDAALSFSMAAADVTRTYTVDGGLTSASYSAPTADGSHTVVVTDTDTAGNIANASLSLTLDNTIATPTVALTNDTGISNGDFITNDAALTLSPTTADVIRSFSVDGGPASASYTAPTADGFHFITVTDTDTAGNIAGVQYEFTLDTTIATPTVALISDTGSSNSDGITQDAALTVSSAAADVTRTYTVDGGALSASYTAPTADGAHTVVVTDTDTAGNTANANISFTLDNTIATPTVALTSDTGSSNSDGITQDAALAVSSAAADVTRTYTIDGGPSSASYTAPTTDGSHTVVVTDTDTAGNTANANLSFTLDNTIATPTVALTNDTGSSNSDDITSDAALTVSTAAADVTRSYTVDGGLASASYTAPMADGAHTVVVTDTDTAGNTASASLSFTLQNAIATPTVVLTNDTGSSNSDGITQDAALTVSTAAADVTRTYAVDGGALSASYTAPTADGAHTVVITDTNTAGSSATASLSFTLDNSIATPTVALTNDTGSSNSDDITSDAALTVSTAAADVTRSYTIDGGLASASYTAPMADGAHTVVVTDTDTAGNTASANLSFTLDNAIATPTVALSNDTGSSSSDNITQDAALSFSPATADVTRTYTVDGGLASANYTAPTADGAHAVVVTDTDTAGNTASANLSFTLDNSIATPTVALTNDTGSSNSDDITSDAALAVSTAAADVTRTYTVDGGLASASYTTPTADGAHTVVVTDTDTAGNAASANLSFTLLNAIATPTVVLTNDTGSSNSDNITQDAALTVSAAAADVTRTYAIDGGALSASYTAPTADGAHTVVITDTNKAGSSATASLSFTLDNTIATPTVALSNDTGSSSSDGITNNAVLMVSAAAADVTRTYTVDGGLASATYTAPTADGAHTVVVTDTDTAGNTANASLSFALDDTIATPTVALTSDTGSSSSDHITSNATLSFSTAAADVTRSFAVDGGLASANYIAPTADGAHTVVVTDTDTAGNTANASISFTLDTTATAAAVAITVISNDTGTSSTDFITNDTTLTVSGSNGALGSGEKVQVSTDGTNWADATTVDATHWSYTDPAIQGASFTYQARVVDAAGNIGNSTSHLVTIDATADSAPTATVDITLVAIDASSENSVAYTIAGVDSDATASVTFTSSGGGSVIATGLGNGAHTVDLTPLHDGTVTASIALTDIAGNSATGIGDTATLNTISGGVTLTGTSGPDTLIGTPFNDTLTGLGGNDTLIGHGGNDNLQGGAGNDTFQYAVGDGADTISGGAGTDSLFITGTTGNDAIHVIASGGTLTGLEGGTIAAVEHVYLDLGAGSGDTLSYAGTLTNVTANLQTSNASGFSSIAGVENLTGGSGNDTLTGNDGDNVLDGGAGNDVIKGIGGNDTLIGGAGNDTLTAGSGNDVISGGDGKDTINYTAGSGVDTIDGGAGIDTLAITGTAGNDTINVVVSGSTITGLAGGTVANVEKATIELLGGTGDTLSYVGTTSNVTVNLPNQTATGFNSIAGIENVTGGSGNNTLIGNSAANVLIGGAGNDLISGGGGADMLTGGGGSDTFVYTTLGNSRAAAFDTIMDFTSGMDKFQIGHALNALTTGIVKTTGITGNLATDLASVLNTTNLKAKGAAEVTISSGADAGTYVVVNDGTAGYNSNNDGVVKVIGSPVLHPTDFIV